MQDSQITIYGPASNLQYSEAHFTAMNIVSLRDEDMYSFVINRQMDGKLHREIRDMANNYWYWTHHRNADGKKLDGIKLSFIDESDAIYVRLNITY